MINYLSTLDLPAAPSFLDLGTGNGHLLFEIYETGEYDDSAFVGIDYSEAAVDLARKIAKEREVEEEVRFEVADIIGEEMQGKDWVPEGGFDVVLDKGTYDAISLSDEKLADGRRIYEDYPRKVSSVLKRDGWLVITSCNWTEEELRAKMGVQKGAYFLSLSFSSRLLFGGLTNHLISLKTQTCSTTARSVTQPLHSAGMSGRQSARFASGKSNIYNDILRSAHHRPSFLTLKNAIVNHLFLSTGSSLPRSTTHGLFLPSISCSQASPTISNPTSATCSKNPTTFSLPV